MNIFNEQVSYMGRLGRLHWFKGRESGMEYNLTIDEVAARPELQNEIDMISEVA